MCSVCNGFGVSQNILATFSQLHSLGSFYCFFFFSTLEIKTQNSKELVGVKLWSGQGWI